MEGCFCWYRFQEGEHLRGPGQHPGTHDGLVTAYRRYEAQDCLFGKVPSLQMPRSRSAGDARYLKRCPLYMYNKRQLATLFNKFVPNEYKIEKISRDYFVSLSIK